MLRLNIGTPPPQPEQSFYRMQINSDLEPVDGDPFAQAPQFDTLRSWQKPPPANAAPADQNALNPPVSSGLPQKPPAHGVVPQNPALEVEPYQGDPWVVGNDPVPVPRSYVMGGGGMSAQPDATAIPAPGTPVRGDLTTISNPNPGWWDTLFNTRQVWDPTYYNAPKTDIPGQAPQLQSGYEGYRPEEQPIVPPAQQPPGWFEGGASGVMSRASNLAGYPTQPPTPPNVLADDLNQSFIPPGASQTPYERGRRIVPEMVEAVRDTVMATPISAPELTPNRGDGTYVGMPAPGTTSYDPSSGDAFGGHASAKALAAASLIPLTSAENLRKRIMIYADDLNVPPDRFFTDPEGNVKWIDLSGQVFSVAPTMSGGTWRAPVDLWRRGIGQALSEAGQIGVNVAGAVGGYYGGGGPAAKLLGGMAGAAAGAFGSDLARQALGNLAAEGAGYKRPPEFDSEGKEVKPRLGSVDFLDIDWWNATGQAIQNAGFEAFARTIPIMFNGIMPSGLFGTNVYRLNRQEMTDLAYILAYDAQTGGHILKRAQAAHELGLPLTPADLLQVTKGQGMDAGYAEAHARLLRSFEQLEVTLANRTGERAAGAAKWMENFYRARQTQYFPRAVHTMLQKIHPDDAFSVKEGFVRFQRASKQIIERLEDASIEAGHRAGWDNLFRMGARADTRNVRQFLRTKLDKAAGETKTELDEVLDMLEPVTISTHNGQTVRSATPVTDYEKLHNIRMDIRSRISKFAGTGKTEGETAALKQLRKVDDLLTSELRRNPIYGLADDAFIAARGNLDDAKQGLLALLGEDAKFQEQLGGALAEAGPAKIAAVKKLFEDFGMSDVFNAHTRAYLEHNLMMAGRQGGFIGDDFHRLVASTPELLAGLKAMAPDARTAELLDQLLDMGHAMDANAVGRVAPKTVRVNTERLSPRGYRSRDALENVVSPLRFGIRRIAEGGPWKDTLREGFKGTRSMNTAVNMTAPAGSVYQNMAQLTIPLAGTSGELVERATYLAADPLNEITGMVPRLSPEWVLKLALPYIHSPPRLDPTAPDIKPPPFRMPTMPDFPNASQLGLGALYYGLTRRPGNP